MEQKVQLLAGKSAQLEMDKGRLNSEIEIFQERVDKFSDKELEKQQSLAQVTAKILDASAKLNQIQEEVARAEREVAETHHRAERKKLELADLEKQAVETNHQVSELREKAAKVRGNLEQLQRKSEESAEEHEAVVKKLGSVLESAAHANLQIAAKNEELRQSANAVFTAKRELDSVNSEMERVKAELKKLAKAEFLNWEVIDMEKEIERRRDEFQRFMRSCADKESAISTKMAELDEVVCSHLAFKF
jgi:chromosome segregation ATPase